MAVEEVDLGADVRNLPPGRRGSGADIGPVLEGRQCLNAGTAARVARALDGLR